MRTLKGWITTTCLALTLMVSTATANGGIIIGGAAEDPCTDTTTTTKEVKIDYGIIIGGLTGTPGIIIGGLTGIIIGGFTKDEPVVNCGIIIGG